METPEAILQQMLDKDAYTRWLGVTVVAIGKGHCTLSCVVREDMLNGFGIAHGGISYGLSDSALAFACNSNGQHAVSIETSISHIKAVQLNDVLTAACSEIQCGKTIGRYVTEVTNQHCTLVARFNGTVFRTEKSW